MVARIKKLLADALDSPDEGNSTRKIYAADVSGIQGDVEMSNEDASKNTLELEMKWYNTFGYYPPYGVNCDPDSEVWLKMMREAIDKNDPSLLDEARLVDDDAYV